MKKIFSTVFGLAVTMFSFAATPSLPSDPVLMTIGDEEILKSEFEYIYQKNNSATTLDKKSLDEYVDLFVNYKLKVAEAKRLGMDQRPTFVSEYSQYEKQLSVPYMRDEEMEEELLAEAFERMKTEVLTSHILVMVNVEEDTLVAWDKINKIYEDLKAGANFSDMALAYSDCPSKSSGGSLGYVNVFEMVYDFENAVYATPVGKISEPFRTRFGYHIVKVYDRRIKYEDFKVSHILLKNTKEGYRYRADSLLALLNKGADFEKLARTYSNDYSTAAKGGDLGYLSQGVFPPQITSAVKSMKEGEIKMVSTAFGLHLLKLTEAVPYKNFEKEKPALKTKLARSDREKMVDEAYLDRLKDKYDVTVYEGALAPFEKLMTITNDDEKIPLYRRLNEPLYSFLGNVYSQEDFLSYFKLRKSTYERTSSGNSVNLKDKSEAKVARKDFPQYAFDSYITEKLFEAERTNLIASNPDLKNLLKEYSDGLLLFEISSEKVWDKASSDTVGLKEFFSNNKAKYTWTASKYKGIVVTCANKKVQEEVEELFKTHTVDLALSEIKDKFYPDKLVKIESGLYAQGANIVVDDKVFHTRNYVNEEYPYVVLQGKVLSAPEVFQDVKGPVTADYQNYLEENWVATLRQRIPVKINKDVLKTIK